MYSQEKKENNEKLNKVVDDLIKEIKTEVYDWNIPKEHEKYLTEDYFENKFDKSTKFKRIIQEIENEHVYKDFEYHISNLDIFQDLYSAIDKNLVEKSKKILKPSRKLLHREIQDWLLLPLIKKQTSFNVETIKTIKALLQEMFYLDSETVRALSENTHMNSQLEKMQSDDASIKSQLEKMQSDDASIKSQLEKMQSDDASIKSQLEKMQSDDASIKSQLEKMQSDDASIKSQLEKMQSDDASIKSQLEKMQSDDASIKSQLEKMQSDDASIKSQLEKNDLHEIIRVNFNAILEKEPNSHQLDWYVNAIRKGELKIEKISQQLRSLPEYRGFQLQKHGDIYTIFGTKMYLHRHDIFISRDLGTHLFWEIDESKELQKYIKKGMSVVDIGANIGYYTILFSKWVGSEGKVFSFEPDPENFKLLLNNISANQCKNVIAEQKAISNNSGTDLLYLDKENLGDHRTFRVLENDAGRKRVKIETIKFDSFLNSNQKIDLVKMDIQGSEMRALEGMKETIKRNKEMLIFTEFWPYAIEKSGYSPKDFLETLIQLGFQIFTLKEDKKEILSLDHPLISNYDKGAQLNLFCIKDK